MIDIVGGGSGDSRLIRNVIGRTNPSWMRLIGVLCLQRSVLSSWAMCELARTSNVYWYCGCARANCHGSYSMKVVAF